MKFVDHAEITVISGDGGPGAVSFRREKFIPKGGPDGGDGGKGGDIYVKANASLQTLLDIRLKRHFKAKNGHAGKGKKQYGPDGSDVTIDVPIGTQILEENGKLLGDLTEKDQRLCVAQGGKGGKGNARFATATKQTPRYAQPGLPGEEKVLRFELKLLANIGIIGLPNAGKSTLLKTLTKANPKIADYPFTTLFPNLGVIKAYDREIVLADIPGLIEGASDGTGLGNDFLRHVERCNLLIHLVAVSDDAKQCFNHYELIRHELSKKGAGLSKKKELIILSKGDTINDNKQQEIEAIFQKKDLQILTISAFNTKNIDKLRQLIFESQTL